MPRHPCFGFAAFGGAARASATTCLAALWRPYPGFLTCHFSPGRGAHPGDGASQLTSGGAMRGWRNTVEVALFKISNSMKPYPSVFHAYTNNTRPVIGFFELHELDEVSNRVPPTS